MYVLSTSCGTTGGKQVETVIYDMHRRVTKLDKGFDGINTTFADLSVKLENNEQTMKSLQSVIEENQVKINQIEKELSELKTKFISPSELISRWYAFYTSDSRWDSQRGYG
jgi:peptidoglycan hydrolase CwlO-like protein